MIQFEIPKNQSSIIKVIGVGGGGSNAVNYMYSLGIDGVDFVVCNTDSQALSLSPVPNKVQLGPHLTAGLGAGANPEIGKQSCEESLEDVSKILKVNTRMVFITAGMGGGTGTGGAPVVAKICRDLGILTVGIVTTPFTYEGRRRMKQAQEGIERMREHVDTVLIISNDKLRQQFGNLPFTKAFSKADDILATAAKCITDVITSTGQINVDFADVCTVMKNGGVAILGNASVAGEDRALHAVEQALNSPLLNDSDITGAKWLLLNITSSAGQYEHTMDEAEAIQAFVQQRAGDNCDVILGMGHDPNLEDRIAVTVIATGFNYKEINTEMPERKPEPERIVVQLDDLKKISTLYDGKAEPVAPKAEAPKAYELAPQLVEVRPQPQAQAQPQVHNDPFQVVMQDSNSAPVTASHELELRIPGEEKPAKVAAPAPPVTDPTSGIQFYIKNEEQLAPAAPVYQAPAPPPPPVYQSPAPPVYQTPAPPPAPVYQAPSQPPYQAPAESPRPMVGERMLTQDEIEEKRRFEEQKRALEERAERLRKMSFNFKGQENPEDIENVPAYMRKKVTLDDTTAASSAQHYSGYTVGFNDNSTQASVNSINTFLDGKKPD